VAPKNREPIHLDPYVWAHPDVRRLCADQDAAGLLRLVHQDCGIYQADIAYWMKVQPTQISQIIKGNPDATGNRRGATLQSWQRIADALNMPDENRLLVGLMPTASTPHTDLAPVPPAEEPPTSSSRRPATDEPFDVDTSGIVDWPTWFGLRVAGLIAAVDGWTPPAIPDELQALLHQELLMFDATDFDSRDLSYSLSRRQALATLAALPLALTAGPSTAQVAATAEPFLSRAAASITACWHLLRGSDLLTIERMLSAYMVPLDALARRPSACQRAAARLASQAHRISGIIALHEHRLSARERHCEQALYFAKLGGEPSTEAAALISLANNYFYRGQPGPAVDIFERGLALEQKIPALQRSRLHAELAVVYGQLGREADALRSIELAERFYPDAPDQDDSALYAEFTPASLTLERGLAHLALAEQSPGSRYETRARDIFDQISQASEANTPIRIRFEIANHQAATAILLRDLDAFESHVHRGIEGVSVLRSKQRHHEMLTIYRRAAQVWPHERRLRALGERLQLTSGDVS
jgi:tetratricopeptide (TPR) repeat protein